jgi:hypothetical protein
MALYSSSSLKTSIIRFWSPPQKKIPFAVLSCAKSMALVSAVSGANGALSTEIFERAATSFLMFDAAISCSPLAHGMTNILPFSLPLNSINLVSISGVRLPPPTMINCS